MFHFSLLYLFIYFLGSQQPPQQYGNIQYKNSAILNRINWLVANHKKLIKMKVSYGENIAQTKWERGKWKYCKSESFETLKWFLTSYTVQKHLWI